MKTTLHLPTKKKLTVHLGSALREARLKAEWTQADVAERVGVATEVYGRMERGGLTPSVPNLRSLCWVLRLDANAALGLQAHEPPTWLTEAAPAEEASPRLRRLLRTLRQLDDQQLAALAFVARSYVQSAKGEPEPPPLTGASGCQPSPGACARRPVASGTNSGAGG